MNEIKTNFIGSKILTLLIVLNCISFFNIRLLNIYESIAFYGNLLALIIIFIIRNNINRKEIGQYIYLLFFSIYAILTLFITKGGFGSVVVPAYSFLLL